MVVAALITLEVESSALKCSSICSPQSVELLGKLLHFEAPAFKFGRNFGFDLHCLV